MKRDARIEQGGAAGIIGELSSALKLLGPETPPRSGQDYGKTGKFPVFPHPGDGEIFNN